MIEVEGLVKSYGDATVLHGIDLDIPAGQVIGYIGPNGAGKTTTVRILTGMLAEFDGTVRVCGFDVRAEPIEVKRRIGLIPESAVLYDPLTPRQYLDFVGQLHGLATEDIDRRGSAMLGELGLAEELDRPIATFSKGMRQKVLIVSGLLHDPEVLFLDEPLSGLDANSVVVLKELIVRLARRGKTIFYCSHVMDVVERVCDRIVIVERGRVIADGSFEELQGDSADESLERIFTELTSAGGHDEVADRLDALIAERPAAT